MSVERQHKAKPQKHKRLTRDIGNHLIVISNSLEQLIVRVFAKGAQSNEGQEGDDGERYCLAGDFSAFEMPSLFITNFESLSDIIEELSLTPPDRLHIVTTPTVHLLRVQLQIGTKLRECNFSLVLKPIAYPEWLQLVLNEVEGKLGRSEQENHPYFVEMQELRRENERLRQGGERLRRELAEAGEKLGKSKLAVGLMQASLEELLKVKMGMEIQLAKLRVKQVEGADGEPCLSPENIENNENHLTDSHTQLAVLSSAIDDEYHPIPLPPIIPIPQITIQQSATKYNFPFGVKSHHKFTLDPTRVNLNNPFTFQRQNQRIRLMMQDEKPKQFNSMVPMPSPVGVVNFRLVNTKGQNIYAGVLLAQRNREVATRREQAALSYFLKGGRCLWEDGVRVDVEREQVGKGDMLSLRIEKGDVLSLAVERRKRIAKWYKNGNLLFRRHLPVKFVNEDLYPFVTMVHEGDEIEFV